MAQKWMLIFWKRKQNESVKFVIYTLHPMLLSEMADDLGQNVHEWSTFSCNERKICYNSL